MNKAELILNYIKTLIWPVMALALILMFRPQMIGLLEGEIEAEIFGVKIKGKQNSGIADLKEQSIRLNTQIEDLKQQLIAQDTLNRSLLEENDRLAGLLEKQNKEIAAAKNHGNLDQVQLVEVPEASRREVASYSASLSSAIQKQVDKTQQITAKGKFNEAQNLEIRGFEALLANNFEESLDLFKQAAEVYPSYHNVAEISSLLQSQIRGLTNPATSKKTKWQVCSIILKRYTWGMPEEIKKEMQAYVDRSGAGG